MPPVAAAAPTPPNSAVVASPLGSVLAAIVDDARADLARRLSAPVEQIELVEVRTVVWPNPGLGCPRPGMVYKQVPMVGMLIRLRSAGRLFDYHGGDGKAPCLCERVQLRGVAVETPRAGDL
jgi:hypothetical protein